MTPARGLKKPDAVRSDDARAAFAADAPDLPLEVLALGSQLAKAGGKDDRALDLVLDALLDQAEDRLGRGEQNGHVELVGNGTDARIGLEAQDLLALGIDRVYLPAARVPQALQEEAPEAPFLVAGADQRHRLGVEDLRELLDGL